MADQDELSPSADWMQIVAERKISEAIDDGQFDSLPGMGQPLQLEDDPLTPAHLRLTNHVLKNARVVPNWLSMEQEIELAKEDTREYFEACVAQKRKICADWLTTARREYEAKMRFTNDLILKYSIVNPFVHRAPIPFRIVDRLAVWDREFVVDLENINEQGAAK